MGSKQFEHRVARSARCRRRWRSVRCVLVEKACSGRSGFRPDARWPMPAANRPIASMTLGVKPGAASRRASSDIALEDKASRRTRPKLSTSEARAPNANIDAALQQSAKPNRKISTGIQRAPRAARPGMMTRQPTIEPIDERMAEEGDRAPVLRDVDASNRRFRVRRFVGSDDGVVAANSTRVRKCAPRSEFDRSPSRR